MTALTLWDDRQRRRRSPAGISTSRRDGRGLPPGRGNVAEGAAVYRLKCGTCHGSLEPAATASFWDEPAAGDYPELVGGQGTLATPNPLRTVGSYWPWATTLWDYVYRTMPLPAPQSLTPNEVYALVAYILWANGIADADAEISRDDLPAVSMPNKDGFLSLDPRPDVETGKDLGKTP